MRGETAMPMCCYSSITNLTDMRTNLRIISLLWMVLIYGTGVRAQSDRVVQRMFLVGDAGELKDGHHPVCDWLKQHVDWNDTSNVLVYLGDNVYPLGVPPEGSRYTDSARKILDYQVSVVAGKKAKAYFIPGNHDWKEGRPGGWGQVKNEDTYLESLALSNVEMLPKGGCPGPVAVQVGEKMVLVCMDSQWWLQQDDRPGLESTCDCKDEKMILNALKDIISNYPDNLIRLAMHHPLYTHGGHGGYYTFKEHLFPLTDLQSGLYIPLPLLGSIYPLTRGVFGNVQDVNNPKYKELRQQVEGVIKGHANVIHVAGHGHVFQNLQRCKVFYFGTGGGLQKDRWMIGSNSLFAREDLGFAVIELHESGKSGIKFYTAGAQDLQQPVYTAVVPPLLPRVDTATIVRSFPDSVTAIGYPGFLAGGFQCLLVGRNSRQEGGGPSRGKVFDSSGWRPFHGRGWTPSARRRVR